MSNGSSPRFGNAASNLVDLKDWIERRRRTERATLLVGTDFSTRSDRALRRATSLARQEKYELLIVHVVKNDEPESLVKQKHSRAADLLDRLEQSFATTEDVNCRTELHIGNVPDQLIFAARASGAELMLVGPHRRIFLRDQFLPTTAEIIIRNSAIPLIVANAAPTGPYLRVMLPTDLGEKSRVSIMAALDMSFVEKTDVVFFHAFDSEASSILGRTMAGAVEQELYRQSLADHAQLNLEKYLKDLQCPRGHRLICESSGLVANDIVRVAADVKVDLIVLTRSIQGAVSRAVLGSNTDAVLRKAKRDLLVIP